MRRLLLLQFSCCSSVVQTYRRCVRAGVRAYWSQERHWKAWRQWYQERMFEVPGARVNLNEGIVPSLSVEFECMCIDVLNQCCRDSSVVYRCSINHRGSVRIGERARSIRRSGQIGSPKR